MLFQFLGNWKKQMQDFESQELRKKNTRDSLLLVGVNSPYFPVMLDILANKK